MNLNTDLTNLLGIGFSFIGFFLVLFFYLFHRFKSNGYFWLYTIILLITLELAYKTGINSRLFLEYPFFYMPGRFFNLLLYPAFLLFIWSINDINFLSKKLKWFILIPSLIYVLILFNNWISIDVEVKRTTLLMFYEDKRPGPFNYWSNQGTFLKGVVIPIVFLGVIGYYFLKFIKHSQNKPNKRLTSILTAVISIYFIFTMLSNILYRIGYRVTSISMIEWPVDIIFLTIVLTLFCIIALLVNMGSTWFPEIKYTGSSLKKENYQHILERIIFLLESEKLFLETSFTLTKLANRLEMNSKYISQVINHTKEMTFVEFINSYRVEETKRQMLDPKNKLLTLEAIGSLSGFKSKSVFFKTFKKVTGQTPSQFVKTHKEKV